MGRFAMGRFAMGWLTMGRIAMGWLAMGRNVVLRRRSVMTRVSGSMPRWRRIALLTVWLGAAVFAFAVGDTIRRGFQDPAFFIGGILATVVINYVYVIVRRRGEVQEAIDLSEAPLVALAVLLPPGEALVAFVLATLFTEMRRDRALIKRLFNVAIRSVGAGLLVVTVGWFHVHGDLSPRDVAV